MRVVATILVASVAGCSIGDARFTSAGDGAAGDDTTAPDATTCTATAATEVWCTNGVDDDCDGYLDCLDVDDCLQPVDASCTSIRCDLTQTELTPFLLPDDGGIHSYTRMIDVSGFSPGKTLEALTGLLGICVTMEHSWFHDVQVQVTSPAGTRVMLQAYLQTNSKIFMGVPTVNDDAGPVPGTGWEYCWSPSATNLAMTQYLVAYPPPGVNPTLPAGDYQAEFSWSPLLGAPLNGTWSIELSDLWGGADSGFIFDWTIKFDPGLISDCIRRTPP